MTTTSSLFTDLSDRELLEEVKCLATSERQATARLVASLAEFDARRLYLGEGCSCLFTYCVQGCICQSTRPSTESKPRERRGDFR